jgi:hypothetical protein
MLAPLDLLEQLQARLDEALGSLPWDAGDGLASLVLGLPSAPALPPELPGPRFGLLHGRRGELRAGYGITAQWRAAGPNRLQELGAKARALSPPVAPGRPGRDRVSWIRPAGLRGGSQPAPIAGRTPWPPERPTQCPALDPGAGPLAPGGPGRGHPQRPAAGFQGGASPALDGLLARLAHDLAEPAPEPLTPGPSSIWAACRGCGTGRGWWTRPWGRSKGGDREGGAQPTRRAARRRSFDLRRLQGS